MEHHTHVDTSGASHGTLKSYGTGFILSLILTVIPFGLVMSGTLPRSAIIVGIFLAAVVQILVHMHYFLHLDTSSEQRWNVMAMAYTVLIIATLVGGSIWIMYNTHVRMMDASLMAGTTAPATGTAAAANASMQNMAGMEPR